MRLQAYYILMITSVICFQLLSCKDDSNLNSSTCTPFDELYPKSGNSGSTTFTYRYPLHSKPMFSESPSAKFYLLLNDTVQRYRLIAMRDGESERRETDLTLPYDVQITMNSREEFAYILVGSLFVVDSSSSDSRSKLLLFDVWPGPRLVVAASPSS